MHVTLGGGRTRPGDHTMLDAIRSRRNLIVGAVVGQAAAHIQPVAVHLFEAGGKDLLANAAQTTLRTAASTTAAEAVTTLAPALLIESAEAGALLGPAIARELAASAGKVAAVTTAKAASRQILRSAVRVGGIGLVIDGAIGAAEGVLGYRKGELTAKQACVHTATEAATGAVSTAAGVVLAAGVVALTGALAIPAITAIGAGGALAAKLGLTRLLRRKPASPPPDASHLISRPPVAQPA